MRTTFLSAILCLTCLIASGCDFERFTGSDETTIETRTLPEFNSIEVHDVVDVIVKFGSEQNVDVEGNSNLIEKIVTKVENGILKIYLEKGNYRNLTAKVSVVIPELNAIAVHDASSIDVEGIDVEELNIEGHDSGDIDIDGEVTNAFLSLSDAVEMDAYNLKIKHCKIEVKDAADANIHATQSLTGKISDAGDVRYKGDPSTVDVQVKDAGNLRPA